MRQLTKKESEAKKRVCLALDVPTVKDALDLVEELSDYVGMFKIGKQIHTAAGYEGLNIVKEIYDRGASVFLDLKYHDTPNTVYQASKAATVKGVYMFDVHIAGGKEMCKKAVQGAEDAAKEKGLKRPKVIGVTVLTSLDDADLREQGIGVDYETLVKTRTRLAKEWGLDGIVCPAKKAGNIEKEFGTGLIYVTPGIKWAGKSGTVQKQLYTPDKAVSDCSSSILVIGSAITKADAKKATAYDILQAMAKNL